MNTYSKQRADKSQISGHKLVQQNKTQQPAIAQFSDNRLQVNKQKWLQQVADSNILQKQAALEEDELLQGKFAVTQKKNNTGLPDNLKSGMENLSGLSLNHVNVHYNSAKPAAVQAHAYAQGSDIHLASGQEYHLPHELGHVVQQMQGYVQATNSVDGVAVNDDPNLESEATSLGEKALRD